MTFLYLGLKYIHILAAFVAVGSNITYGVWQSRVQTDRQHFGFVIKTIKVLDDRVANPAYGVLLITGLLMVFAGHWSIGSLWIVLALIGFAAILVLSFTVYVPAQKGQIAAFDSGDTSAVESLGRRTMVSGIGLGVIALLILIMMVFKPHL